MRASIVKVAVALTVVLSVAAVGAVPAAADECDQDEELITPEECSGGTNAPFGDGTSVSAPDTGETETDTDDELLSNEQEAALGEASSTADGVEISLDEVGGVGGGGMFDEE